MTDRSEDRLATAMRTGGAGTLRAADAGRDVALCGWVHRRRDHGGLVFIDLRDRWGIVQCVADPDRLPEAAYGVVEGLRAEHVVRVQGEVTARPADSVNPELDSGEVEVRLTDCRLLAEAATPPFPVDVDKEGGEVSEELRLRHRYLELRRPGVAAAFGVRHRLTMETRAWLDGRGFWEIETPMLTRRTPEGARDYLVPSRVHPGRFYALPQSPQIYKQLLMVAGFDRYFQIARCFRDEDLRADRQPEFTQIDVEMAFVERDDVIETMSGLYRHLFRAVLDVEVGEIPRLSWEETMRRFGSDKPDLRIPHELVDLTENFRETGFRVFDSIVAAGGSVVGLRVPGGAGASRSVIDRWTDAARAGGAQGLVWARRAEDGWVSSIDKFVEPERWTRAGEAAGAGPGDLILAVADRTDRARRAAGALRVHLARERGWIEEGTWRPLWVLDFPLFEEDSGGGITPSHHPFTAPVGGLEALAAEDPLSIRAEAYDLVLNGYELGGGSIRIHQRAVQERVFELLGIDADEARQKFGFLLEAFEYGAPPHGGFAAGLDRTAMLFAGGTSLREVIAFPKTTSASALLEGAPSRVDEADLAELHIRVTSPVDPA
ncbi:MAG TPA: aspartate--tRNA ligase [Gemmatimonadota bacterium]|nr:aspartate--tRNA ligase [Gemmatimonadota bacterium]